MEKYYKISESKLIELLARDWKLSHMECAGVDNWDDGGLIHEFFVESCEDAGFHEEDRQEYYNYTYKDLARTLLSDYQETE